MDKLIQITAHPNHPAWVDVLSGILKIVEAGNAAGIQIIPANIEKGIQIGLVAASLVVAGAQ
jgi:hypothetical protein